MCGISAYHQNGITKKRSWDLTEQIRKLLLHSVTKFPGTIYTCLWPYVLCTENEVYNVIPNNRDGSSSIKCISRFGVTPQLKHNHKFECLIYKLNPLLIRLKTRTMMKITIAIWNVLGFIPKACKVGLIDTKIKHKPSIFAVLCQLWWFLQNSARYILKGHRNLE